jgi:ribosome-associated protein
MESKNLHTTISAIIDDAKGRDIQVINVRDISDVTDYIVIASGTSNRHVSSVADRIISTMRDEHNIKPLGSEGKQGGEWVLVDFGDVVVHIMHPDTREFYQLEKLWADVGDREPVEQQDQ